MTNSNILQPSTTYTPNPRLDRAVSLYVFLAALALVVAFTTTRPASWNDISRVAAIQARVEQNTWSLDSSPWLDATEDKVLLNQHYYSGKMPLLSGIGALEYTLLHNVTGLSLSPDCAPGGACAYYWLSLTLVGIPFALMLALLYLWLRWFNLSVVLALVGAFLLGLATEVFPYALTLNHHVPAGISLFVALFLFVVYAPRNPRWLLGVGFAASFAVMCDPLSGLFGAGLFLLVVLRYRWQAAYFVLGALPPLLATAYLDFQITHTVLPPYVTLEGYANREAGAARGYAGAGTPDDVPQYAFKMFLGAQGLFAYNPILFFAVAGIAIAALARPSRLRAEAILVGLSAVGVALYLVFRTGNLGGNAYGERYFISILPVTLAFLVSAPPLYKTRARYLFALFFAIALFLSLYSSYQGMRNPWQFAEPPLQLTRNSTTGAIGFRVNIR